MLLTIMKRLSVDSIKAPSRLKRAIREFVKESVERYRKRIDMMVLYGSVVRGEANEESDIDVLVVWNGTTLDAMDSLGEIALKVLLRYGCDISIHPMSPKHYDYLSKINTHFFRNVAREGIVVA